MIWINVKKNNNWKLAKVEKLKRMDKYYEGGLEGAEKMKAERDILLENQKRVDNQGLIIDSIQENVKVVGTNLNNINTELNSQGEKIDRIHDRVIETEQEVKKTAKIMNKLERKQSCSKIVTVIAIILFGIFDVAFGIFGLYKKLK